MEKKFKKGRILFFFMKKALSDNQITFLLSKRGILFDNSQPYIRLYNNNQSITDNKNFFIKTTTPENVLSLIIEAETMPHLSFAPKLLCPEIVYINDIPVLIMEYIVSHQFTVENVNENNASTIMKQLCEIHTLEKNIYTQPRTLEGTLTLVNKRLAHSTWTTDKEKAQIKLLVKTYVEPYVKKYSKIPNLAHTDLLLRNIILTDTEQVKIIDYEGIKPMPAEIDLASLYQDLCQSDTHYEAYTVLEQAYKEHAPINYDRWEESVLFKNTLSTTSALTKEDKRDTFIQKRT